MTFLIQYRYLRKCGGNQVLHFQRNKDLNMDRDKLVVGIKHDLEREILVLITSGCFFCCDV